MRDGLRSAVAQGRRLVGTVLTLPGATAAELLAEPFDVVWIDLEHAALGPRDAQEMILGAQAAGVYAMVRLPVASHDLMTVMLDAGADGVVLASVGSPEQAAGAVQRAVHPPDGSRGWGPRRLALRRRHQDGEPPQPSVWAQIESAGAVDRVDEIAAVPGIDAVVVGTADLSLSLGAPLDLGAPDLLRAIAAVRRASERTGVALGLAGALDRVPEEARERVSILVHSTDARMCAEVVDETAARLRDGRQGE
jgi:4-hydroxy-2-oxoheptanedioate aldolase